MKYSLSLGASLGLVNLLPTSASALSNKKTMVYIYLPGGYDTMSFVPPYGDPAYYQRRPKLAIKKADVLPATGTSIHGFNPLLKGFSDIYEDGNMAVFPAIHYENPNRSHFESISRISTNISNVDHSTGWLNRAFNSQGNSSHRMYSLSNPVPELVKGAYPVSLANQYDALINDASGITDKVKTLFAAFEPDSNKILEKVLKNNIGDYFQFYETYRTLNIENYSPENNAEYLADNFGNNLKQAAALIKGNATECIYIQFPFGGDTHQAQATNHSKSLPMLSKNLKAFYEDLGDKIDDVAILVFSEFGRTIDENSTNGTDHGHAGAWFLIGGNVNGGFYGGWNGLANNGRFLEKTVNMADLFKETLTDHIGLNLPDDFFPGHVHTPLNVFKGGSNA